MQCNNCGRDFSKYNGTKKLGSIICPYCGKNAYSTSQKVVHSVTDSYAFRGNVGKSIIKFIGEAIKHSI